MISMTLTKTEDGWEAIIPERDGTEFAKTFSRDPYSTLKHAIPYLECLIDDALKEEGR